MPTFNESNLMISLFRVLNTFLDGFASSDSHSPSVQELNQVDDAIDSVFLMAVIWSLGVVLDLEARRVFETQLRELVKMHGTSAALPDPSISIFDVYLLLEENRFEVIVNLFEEFQNPSITPYYEIVVPTLDLLRTKIIGLKLLEHGFPVLLSGPTGSSKTTNLLRASSTLPDKYQLVVFTFSGTTSSK